MNKICIILIIAILYVGCTKERSLHSSIYGNWYSLETDNIDTSCDEVFISDTSFIYFLSLVFFSGPYKYRLINDSVCYYFYSNNNYDTFSIRINNDHQFIILMPENQTRLFNRIKVRNGEITLDRLLKYKYWDENIEYKTFLYSFYSRMLREFYAKGFTKDSVIRVC